ncbi:MAG: hypothetical protein KIT84_25620 [Labilithrix sp.]|nr:hypothetical protein [Labilithrix sp.]MCW5814432.1 hypothetical protein [Labilithrix sp.]
MAKDDDLLPKKKSAASTGKGNSSGDSPSPQMIRLMRITRTIGIVLGGFVTLVGMMSVVGFATDNFWVRLLVAVVVVVGFPAFVSDRLFKRTKLGGGAAMVVDVFAIVLLGVALLLVAADFASKPLLVSEGDRYAQSGSRTMARLAYFLGGVSPVFPEERPAAAPATPKASK